jgi:hypothetical protein
VSGHHSCKNYWPGNGTADRIATRRLSLLPRTAAPFLSGAWAECAAFFFIGLVAAQFAPNPITPLTKPSRGGDRRQDDVVVMQR